MITHVRIEAVAQAMVRAAQGVDATPEELRAASAALALRANDMIERNGGSPVASDTSIVRTNVIYLRGREPRAKSEGSLFSRGRSNRPSPLDSGTAPVVADPTLTNGSNPCLV